LLKEKRTKKGKSGTAQTPRKERKKKLIPDSVKMKTEKAQLSGG